MQRCRAAWATVAVVAIVATGCGVSGFWGTAPERRVALPAGFPADIPLPASAVVSMVRDLGPGGLHLVLETAEGAAQVDRRFLEAMRGAGWTAEGDLALEAALFRSYRKGERSVAVGLSRAGETTVMGIAIAGPLEAAPEGGRG